MVTQWKSRAEVDTNWWDNDRVKHWTKSRNYMLGSFFELILTAITDPKDDKAIRIKTDPAYYQASSYWTRIQNNNTSWKTSNRI